MAVVEEEEVKGKWKRGEAKRFPLARTIQGEGSEGEWLRMGG